MRFAPLVLAASCCIVFAQTKPDAVIDIGSRLEPLVDDALIAKFSGKAELLLHHPVARDIAIVHDAPWEGSGTGYHSVFKDGDVYRMYYKAWHLDVQPGTNGKAKLSTNSHPLYTCYAESKDGIHWTKPNLGIVEFRGSKENNIVLDVRMGAILGGHVRVGLEDNLYLGRGQLAPSNAEQVLKIRRILSELSLESATPDEARVTTSTTNAMPGCSRVGLPSTR